jgi:hypothetical protein
MRSMVVIAASVGLTACAPQHMWVKDGATAGDFERDKNVCIYEAKLATASYSQGATARTRSGAIAQGISEGLTMGFRELELATLCMQTKGYVKVPIGSAPSYAAPSGGYVVATSAQTANASDNRLITCNLPEGSPMILAGQCRQRGGTIVDDAVAVSTTPSTPSPSQVVSAQASQPGQYSFEAEKVARAEQCSTAPVASLTAKGPGFESYTIPCSNGDALAVRCDFGNCRTLK